MTRFRVFFGAKYITLCLSLVISTTCLAQELGTATLSVTGDEALGFSYELENDFITGSLYGFGTNSGRAQLSFIDGKWRGEIGLEKIHPLNTRNATFKAGTPYEYETVFLTITTESRKTFSIVISKRDRRPPVKGSIYKITGSGSLSPGRVVLISGDLTDERLSIRNDHRKLNLASSGNNASFEGSFQKVRWPNILFEGAASLEASGPLDLHTLIENDPGLFVLLYVLPYSLLI